MESIADVWGLAADKWEEVMAQVGDADWDKPTTCEGWTVRDLVDHAMFWQGRGGGAFDVGVADDADCDGYASGEDCNDTDAAIQPEAVEICDGVDNDCNGEVDDLPDVDGDGYSACDGDCCDSMCMMDLIKILKAGKFLMVSYPS